MEQENEEEWRVWEMSNYIVRQIKADECIVAIELAPKGFDGANRLLGFSYYDFFECEK